MVTNSSLEPRASDFHTLGCRPNRGATKADRETALRLLNACVEVEKTCFDQVLRYIGDNSPRTRRLLEEILRLEEEHAENLIGVLQGHRAATDVGARSRRIRSVPG